jgi:hypothetical protein
VAAGSRLAAAAAASPWASRSVPAAGSQGKP